jgi:hypothetical protein
MRAIFRIATVLMLVLSLGLHWALLQTVAWTGMIVAYSQDAPLLTAVANTFDGKHPCPMCKAIKQGRAEERTQSQQKSDSTVKLEFPLASDGLLLTPPELGDEPVVFAPCLKSSSFEPPTPPPRRAVV